MDRSAVLRRFESNGLVADTGAEHFAGTYARIGPVVLMVSMR
jgi:hypothetical protein